MSRLYNVRNFITHESACDDNMSKGPHSQERRRITRGSSTRCMERPGRPGPKLVTTCSGRVRIRELCSSTTEIKLVQQNTTAVRVRARDDALDQDVHSIEIEKGLDSGEAHVQERGKAIGRKCMRVLKDGSRKSSRCKPGDRNFGGVAIAARKRASGAGKKKICRWRVSTNRRHFRSNTTKGPDKGTEEG
jgi:hypothetical protein